MKLTDKEEKVIEFLIKEYDAKAIIFVGSRAVGDFKPNSDWDIWVFSDKKNRIPAYKLQPKYNLENEDLDLYFASTKQKFDYGFFGVKLRFNKIVYDPKKIAKNIISNANKFYSKGADKWTKQYAIWRIDKVKRYENKFKDLLIDKNYLELYDRIANAVLETTFTWWYGVRGEWLPRPQQMFSDLKKRDKKFYDYLKKISDNETTQIERIEILKKLHRYFFNSKEYRKIAGTEVENRIKELEK